MAKKPKNPSIDGTESIDTAKIATPADSDTESPDKSERVLEAGDMKNSATVDSSAEASVEVLEQTIADLQGQLADHQELALRIKAEADNQLKREQRELQKHRQRSLENIMRELIEVRDTLERGLEAMPADNPSEQYTALRDGTTMTLRLLDKALSNNGLEILNPLHEAFNPELHEAVGMQPSDEHESNVVIAVMQKGYQLHDRLLRPAMVMVST